MVEGDSLLVGLNPAIWVHGADLPQGRQKLPPKIPDPGVSLTKLFISDVSPVQFRPPLLDITPGIARGYVVLGAPHFHFEI